MCNIFIKMSLGYSIPRTPLILDYDKLQHLLNDVYQLDKQSNETQYLEDNFKNYDDIHYVIKMYYEKFFIKPSDVISRVDGTMFQNYLFKKLGNQNKKYGLTDEEAKRNHIYEIFNKVNRSLSWN